MGTPIPASKVRSLNLTPPPTFSFSMDFASRKGGKLHLESFSPDASFPHLSR
jgi:hypothetical protein